MGKAKRVTSKEVAERAGVSRAVVSYVINNGPRPLSSETRAKVKKAIEEMGYYPNELVRSLKAKQTATVGVMIPNLINPVYSKIVESLEEICAAAGYTVWRIPALPFSTPHLRPETRGAGFHRSPTEPGVRQH